MAAWLRYEEAQALLSPWPFKGDFEIKQGLVGSSQVQKPFCGPHFLFVGLP